MAVEVGTDYYAWQPNYLSYRDPETKAFIGNAIGNTSMEEQINEVVATGMQKKAEMEDICQEKFAQIEPYLGKYTALWQIVENVETALTSYFGE